MDTAFILELYSYNHWANQRAMAAASQLKNDTFTRNLGNSFSSVRDTLAHIMAAEWIWLERWNGRSPGALLGATDFPTRDALAKRWTKIQKAQNAFLDAVTPERLQANLIIGTQIRGAKALHTHCGSKWYTWLTTPLIIADKSQPCCGSLERSPCRPICSSITMKKLNDLRFIAASTRLRDSWPEHPLWTARSTSEWMFTWEQSRLSC